MPRSNPSAKRAERPDPASPARFRSGGRPAFHAALLLLLLAGPGPFVPATAQEAPPRPAPRTYSPTGPDTGILQQRLQDLRDENASLRRRLHELETRLTRMEAEIPHVREGLKARIERLDQHMEDRIRSLQSNLTLYMRVGTFVLILIGVFGFGYIHQILRGVIQRSVSSHLRSESFARTLESKVGQVAEESRESIIEASKEETRQLTRKLIDEFLTEERSRIEKAVEEEQDALEKLRREHLNLQSPVPEQAGEYLEKVASAASHRSLELLTDEEVYYAMLQADSRGEHLEAERYARELLRRHPGTADSLANLAWILEHTDRLQEAEAHYKRALEAAPDRSDIARYYAELLDREGRWEEARRILEETLRSQPDNPRTISHFANLLMRHGQLEEARELLRKPMEDNPGSRALLDSFARLLEREGQPESALDCLRRALEVAPEDPGLLAEAARLELDLDDAEAATGHIGELLRLNNEDDRAWRLQGRAHLAQGRFAEAETDFRKALSLAGSHAPDQFRLGLALLGQGRRAEATDLYNQGLEQAEGPGEVEREGLEPLRRLSRSWAIPDGEEFIQWLEEASGGGPQANPEEGPSA